MSGQEVEGTILNHCRHLEIRKSRKRSAEERMKGGGGTEGEESKGKEPEIRKVGVREVRLAKKKVSLSQIKWDRYQKGGRGMRGKERTVRGVGRSEEISLKERAFKGVA